MLGWLLASIDRRRRWPANYENRIVAAVAGGGPRWFKTQVAVVTKLHKAGKSLNVIVDETNLSKRIVRTIVGREHGTDRTTKARREKIEIDKSQRAHWKAQQRTGDALPKRVADVIETGNALVTEAKGLGRGR